MAQSICSVAIVLIVLQIVIGWSASTEVNSTVENGLISPNIQTTTTVNKIKTSIFMRPTSTTEQNTPTKGHQTIVPGLPDWAFYIIIGVAALLFLLFCCCCVCCCCKNQCDASHKGSGTQIICCCSGADYANV